MDTIIGRGMENFTNETIDTKILPRFEDVLLTPLQPSYMKIIWFNIIIIFTIIAIAAGLVFYFIEDSRIAWLPAAIAYIIAIMLTIVLSVAGFKNRGFAFRSHDAIYRNGIIATTTTIIPYNRVQHVALHEGFLSRKLGLASIEIFTAGGDKSDIQIPGLEKEHAERIKQLLMGKIINQAGDGE